MKKIYLLLMILFLCIGCSHQEIKKPTNQRKLKVVATIFPQYDFSKAILQDKAELKVLLKPNAEAHAFNPSPNDIKEIESSDILVMVGGENDYWIEKILNSLDQKPAVFKLIDMVDTLEEEIKEGMQDNHNHNHSHQVDEHVWTSIKNAIKIVNRLAKIYSIADLDNAEFYQENAKSYIQKLKDLDLKFENTLKNNKHNLLIFGDRFPFRYLANDYHLDYFAAFSGCSFESEASASTVKFLIDKVNENQIPVVFNIELSNGLIADAICDASDAVKMTLHSAHNLSQEEFDQGLNYLQIMENNLEVLKKALQ